MSRRADAELLDRLRDAFVVEVSREDAPLPSAALREVMDHAATTPSRDELTAARIRGVRPRARRFAVAVAATVGLVVCSLAAAGALPAPAQRGIANLVRHVGIDLPSPGDDGGSHAPGTAPRPSASTAPVVAPTGPATGAVQPSEPAPTLPEPTATSPTLPGETLPPLTPPETSPLPPLPGAPLPAPTVPTLLPPLGPLVPGAGDLLTDPFQLLP